MAKTNKMARFIKGPKGVENFPLRNGTEKSSALYLLQLRSRHAEAQLQSQLVKRKLTITIDHQDGHIKPVKITQG